MQVTDAIKNNQLRGQALASKFGYEINVVKAFDSELSIEDIKVLYKKLSSLEQKYEPLKRLDDSNKLTKSTVEYLANGSGAALAWCRLELRKAGILKSYSKEITAEELNKEDQLPKIEIQVAKSLNEEKRLATFLVLEPQDDDGTTNDLHADWYDKEMVEKSCHNFNKYCMKANLLHLMPTSAFEFVESYITKADMVLGDKYIKEGSWLATVHVDTSELGEEIWQGIKSGYFNGLSIQALGTVEEIEE